MAERLGVSVASVWSRLQCGPEAAFSNQGECEVASVGFLGRW